jgi:hypothetical protein
MLNNMGMGCKKKSERSSLFEEPITIIEQSNKIV